MVGDFARTVDFIGIGVVIENVSQEFQEVFAFITIARFRGSRLDERLELGPTEKQAGRKTVGDPLAAGFLGYLEGFAFFL